MRKHAARIRKKELRQLQTLVMLGLLQRACAMEGGANPVAAQQLMEQMAGLARAATRAGTAAESALAVTAGGARSSSSSVLFKLQTGY